jgi:hypothetical protein
MATTFFQPPGRPGTLQRGLHRAINNPYHLDIFTVFSGI